MPLANILAIAIILVLPTLFLVLLLNIFIYIFGDIIILAAVFSWFGLVAAVTIFISKMLSRIGVDTLLFYVIFALCALPISQFAYNLNVKVSGEYFEILPLAAMMLIANIIIVPFAVNLLATEKITVRGKLLIAAITVAVCVGLTFIR